MIQNWTQDFWAKTKSRCPIHTAELSGKNNVKLKNSTHVISIERCSTYMHM
jgi:hypothetical protein